MRLIGLLFLEKDEEERSGRTYPDIKECRKTIRSCRKLNETAVKPEAKIIFIENEITVALRLVSLINSVKFDKKINYSSLTLES